MSCSSAIALPEAQLQLASPLPILVSRSIICTPTTASQAVLCAEIDSSLALSFVLAASPSSMEENFVRAHRKKLAHHYTIPSFPLKLRSTFIYELFSALLVPSQARVPPCRLVCLAHLAGCRHSTKARSWVRLPPRAE